MRILDNFELPGSVRELLNISEEDSFADDDPVQEAEDVPKDEITNSADEETKLTEEEETSAKPDEEEEAVAKVTFKPDPNLPKLVRMANLCVASGNAVNGVAAIHSEIVKNEVFNEFYKVTRRVSLLIFWFCHATFEFI